MKVIYPGSFDPLTNGHLDILDRASRMFGAVTIALLHNAGKQALFSVEERIQMLHEALPGSNVEQFGGLLTDLKPDIVVRGLRSVSDYEAEWPMALMNRQLLRELDTVFLLSSPEHRFLSSRLVKEVGSLGGDVTAFVPEAVARKLKEKFPAR